MKSYRDIEKQVNRIIDEYLVDEYCTPYNTRAKRIITKIRDIQKRYTFNINRYEGFCVGDTFEEQDRQDSYSVYFVFKNENERYERKIYAGY